MGSAATNLSNYVNEISRIGGEFGPMLVKGVLIASVRPKRRLDIDFFIPYDQDVEKVKATVGEILQKEEIVLQKPAPRVVIDKFTPDYMEMKARFWVERKHALTGRWGLNEKIKLRFEEEGISMASARLEVSLPQKEQMKD